MAIDKPTDQQDDSDSNSDGGDSLFEYVSDVARSNPILVIGTALAAGALITMALSNRNPQRTTARNLERKLGRQLASMETYLDRNRPLSGLADSLAELSAAAASRVRWPDSTYLDGFMKSARDVVAEVSDRARRSR